MTAVRDHGQSPATGGRETRALRAGRAAEVACVLLLVQASLALLSSSILFILGAAGIPVPLTQLGAIGMLVVAHPIFLVVLAWGVARGRRWARRAALIFESLVIAGALFNLALNAVPGVQTETAPLAIGTNLLLPAAIVALLKSGGAERQWRLAPLGVMAAALLFVSAGAHLALAPGHGGEAGELGLLFLLDAGLLAAAGAGVALAHRQPRATGPRRWRRLAIALLVGNVLAYVLYVGSGREHVEQVALAVKLLEIIALGLLLLPSDEPDRPPLRRPRRAWLAPVGAVLLLGTTTGLVAWGKSLKHHDVPGPGEPPHVVEPVPGAGVSRKLVFPVTPAEEAAAARLVEETRASAARYADLAVALEAGYAGEVNRSDSHLKNEAFKADDAIMDPTRPEQLVYAATANGPVLLGVVYVMPAPRRPGPEIGGALTRWHTHSICVTFLPPFVAGLVTPFGTCPFGAINFVTPEMIHVWLVDNPAGQFADQLDAVALKALLQGVAGD